MNNEVRALQDSLGTIRTKEGNKPYTGKNKALALFRFDHPGTSGRIIPTMLSADPPIFKVEIYVDDVLVAAAHAAPEGNTTSFRKVEGAAIRRALEVAGYGADMIMARLADLIGVDESKRMLGSGKAEGERRMGSTPPPDEPQPPRTPPPAAPRSKPVTEPPPSAFKTAYKPKYGEPPPVQKPMPESVITEYIKVLPKDLEIGDVVDPEDGGAPMMISSIEELDAGTILVRSQIGVIDRATKYSLSNGLVHVTGGSKFQAYQRNHALAPKNGAGHPLWVGAKAKAS